MALIIDRLPIAEIATKGGHTARFVIREDTNDAALLV